MNIAFWGGSFNPPHAAHQLACLLLLEMEGFDQVWLVPCYRHAFAKELVGFSHRLAMCRLLARPLGRRVWVSDAEKDLLLGGVNRTAYTLEQLARSHPQHRFTLVIGSDLVTELPSWRGVKRLLRNHSLLVLPRPGYPVRSCPFPVARLALPRVSSTKIRSLARRGLSLQGLVPASVASYLEKHRLFRRGKGG